MSWNPIPRSARTGEWTILAACLARLADGPTHLRKLLSKCGTPIRIAPQLSLYSSTATSVVSTTPSQESTAVSPTPLMHPGFFVSLRGFKSGPSYLVPGPEPCRRLADHTQVWWAGCRSLLFVLLPACSALRRIDQITCQPAIPHSNNHIMSGPRALPIRRERRYECIHSVRLCDGECVGGQ